MRKLIILFTFSTFLFFSSAFAQDSSQQSSQASTPKPEMHRHHHGLMTLLPEGLFGLSLTSTQALAIKQLLEENKSDWQTLRSEMQMASQILDDAINAESFDETAVRDAAKNLAEIQEEVIVLKAKIVQAIRTLLNDAQLTSLDAIRTGRQFNPAPQDASIEDNQQD